jgi:ATP-binding cassette subfamily F protein 3
MPRDILVNLKNVSIQLQDSPLIDKLSFSVHCGELVALIGPNGCGKTTILKLVESRWRDDARTLADEGFRISGSVVFASDTNLVYLPQSLTATIRSAGDTSDAKPDALAVESRLCAEFGLAKARDAEGAMSDGERQKRALVATLLSDADLYLLDEPTNYLDMTGITALEHHLERLIRLRRGVILVTHDRTLVENFATQTLLITNNGIFHSSGGSSAVLSLRDSDYQSRNKRAGDIRTKIRQLQADMNAKAGWAAAKEKQKIGGGGAKGHISRLSMKLAKRAKAAQHRAQKEIDRLQKTKPYVPKRLNLQFPQNEIRNRDVFSLKDVSFRYSDGREPALLKEITLSGTTRDKTCLMGTNGAGKTTLVRLILNQLRPQSGTVYLNDSAKTAYIPQGLHGLFGAERLLDNFADCGCDETTIRVHLGAALLRGDKVHEPLSHFSYGELMRAAIVRCLLSGAEFLFLDEPTSHLDIESIEVLEQMLGDFNGGVLMISHDRTFVENVAERLFVLEGGRLRLV